ncbi:helix-turn-helix transcriptional regulator [Isoptericola sp. NPDC057191]|uniref:helix-turn-helix transcriptional regulator n=1 Tax=Isoptericola sp. NPDC057191 TaxID=3346041 RepID=UPI0036366722
MSTTTPVRTYYWIEELSDELGIPLATLRHWRRLGEGGPKSFLIGRRVAYDRADVTRWIKAQRDGGRR